jgi:hypothetical protein
MMQSINRFHCANIMRLISNFLLTNNSETQLDNLKIQVEHLKLVFGHYSADRLKKLEEHERARTFSNLLDRFDNDSPQRQPPSEVTDTKLSTKHSNAAESLEEEIERLSNEKKNRSRT